MKRLAVSAVLSAVVWASACGKSPCNKGNIETADKWCVIPLTCPEGSQPSLHHERCELPDGGIAGSGPLAGSQSSTISTSGRGDGVGVGGTPSIGPGGSSAGQSAAMAGHPAEDNTAGIGGHGGKLAASDDADAGMSSLSPDAGPQAECGDGKLDPGEKCDGDCPTSCSPTTACKSAVLRGLAEDCNAECVLSSITTCEAGDDCCPDECNVDNDSDCSISCGDGVLSANEKCEPGSEKPCPTETDCIDDNPCTLDELLGNADRCTAECSHTPLAADGQGDLCCPRGANANVDPDCDAQCGNGVVEDGELCDGNCPTTCNDDNPCTEDSPAGEGCAITCRHEPLDLGTVNECGGCARLPDQRGSSCTVGNGTCAARGTYECDGTNNLICNATPPMRQEVCDGADNDCDNMVDEAVTNACGGCTPLAHAPGESCSAGSGACVGTGYFECQGADTTVCSAKPVKPPEVCDGKDNDCDGNFDEGVVNACGGCKVLDQVIGATCQYRTDICSANGTWQCGGSDSVTCRTSGNGRGEVCDGMDNDCDRGIDEGNVCSF